MTPEFGFHKPKPRRSASGLMIADADPHLFAQQIDQALEEQRQLESSSTQDANVNGLLRLGQITSAIQTETDKFGIRVSIHTLWENPKSRILTLNRSPNNDENIKKYGFGTPEK